MLSQWELLRLAEIERQLWKDAPRLARTLTDFGRRRRNHRVALAVASCCLGLISLITAGDLGVVLVGLALIGFGAVDIAVEMRWRCGGGAQWPARRDDPGLPDQR
ncbi:MAG: DUF3040 domain-containing protein [Pseudonocardiaceae bacterium]